MRHLYKSRTNKVCCGVIGGIGAHFEVDSALLRVVWILIVVFTGFLPGLIAYILAVFVVPEQPK